MLIEIRAAEGGDDAKDLVEVQLEIYLKRCAFRGLQAVLVDQRPGLAVIQINDTNLPSVFADEPGGHRWQRVPPTETRGRVHTSTVTVAVLAEPTPSQLPVIPDRDLEVTACRGSGPGGQNRNKVNSAIQMKHLPSGLAVRCETERSQHQNRAIALALLRSRLWQKEQERTASQTAGARKEQIGSGMRGDKRRTIRVRDGQVHDHVTGRRWQLKEYLKGEW